MAVILLGMRQVYTTPSSAYFFSFLLLLLAFLTGVISLLAWEVLFLLAYCDFSQTFANAYIHLNTLATSQGAYAVAFTTVQVGFSRTFSIRYYFATGITFGFVFEASSFAGLLCFIFYRITGTNVQICTDLDRGFLKEEGAGAWGMDRAGFGSFVA